jgi:hypothetical protein
MDRESCYIIIKDLTHQDDIAILNVYAPNNRAAEFVKQQWYNWNKKQINSHI